MDAGELVIKTVLDTKDVKGELRQLENELKQEEKSLKEFLKYKVELEMEADSYEEVLDTLEKIKELQGQGKTEIEIDGQIYQLENLKEEQEYIKGLWERINEEIQDSTKNVNELRQKLNIKRKILEAQEGMKKFGKEIGKNIKQIGKMALALIGIRSIYGAIRNAVSILSNSNEDISNTLTYFRTMMATVLEPIILKIIELLKYLMATFNLIFKRWFGRDLFAETDRNLKKANKSAGALKKTLAGFDEMNILNSSSSGGGGGITAPELNLDNYEQEIIKFKDSLKKINWEEVSKYIGDKITSTLTSSDFWRSVWESIVWTVENIFVFPANFMNNIITNLFSESKTRVDADGKLIKEEKTYAEKIVGQLVGAILQQFGLKFNPLGMFIDSFSKGTQQIKDEFKTNAENFGGSYALTFMDAFLSGFTLYRVFKEAITNIVKLWNSTIGKLTGKTIKINVEYNSPYGSAGGRAKGGIYYPQLPKLAVGGIVNQPGRGIPYHGAIIGERGAEAVVPLTDSQQMELLGATIGRYITINNTNPIYMNGRLIAKEINRSNAEDDFAFNR